MQQTDQQEETAEIKQATPLPITYSIQLLDGWTDPNGTVHKEVTFGHRLTGLELMILDTHPSANYPTYYQALVLRGAITEFGTVPMPAPVNALLELTEQDYEELDAGHDEFIRLSAEGREPETLAANRKKLRFGFSRDGVIYPVVEFGRQLKRMDELEADKKGLRGVARLCYQLSKQIVKISSADNQHHIEEEIPLQMFEALDGEDIRLLRDAAIVWQGFFRRTRAGVQA